MTPANDDPAAAILAREYDARLMEFGDTGRGAHWPNEDARRTRYEVMLDIVDPAAADSLRLVELGCGSGGLLGYLQASGTPNIDYLGVDSSELALSYARSTYSDASTSRLELRLIVTSIPSSAAHSRRPASR